MKPEGKTCCWMYSISPSRIYANHQITFASSIACHYLYQPSQIIFLPTNIVMLSVMRLSSAVITPIGLVVQESQPGQVLIVQFGMAEPKVGTLLVEKLTNRWLLLSVGRIFLH